jgi:hypothetical protein
MDTCGSDDLDGSDNHSDSSGEQYFLPKTNIIQISAKYVYFFNNDIILPQNVKKRIFCKQNTLFYLLCRMTS